MIIIIAILIFAIILFFYKKNRVKISINNANGKYKVSGNKNKFVIKKDKRFEFLVEDGVIVACKDKLRDDKFKYYE